VQGVSKYNLPIYQLIGLPIKKDSFQFTVFSYNTKDKRKIKI